MDKESAFYRVKRPRMNGDLRSRVGSRKETLIVFTIAFFFFMIGNLFSQTVPLDEKAKYEKALEQKVDEVLLRVLGPNQGKTFIQATLDFSRSEKFEINSNAESSDKESLFKWMGISKEPQTAEQLLPGFANPFADETKSYQKYLQFPVSILKRLDVTLVLNENIDKASAENIRIVVSELLSLNSKRGDKLSVVRAPFAPMWKTVWYAPETMSLLFKYIALTLMGIIAIIVMAIGFLKLASAMSSMAKTQTHEINMDFKNNALGGNSVRGDLTSEIMPLSLEKKKDAAEEESAEENEKPIVFNVKFEQLPFLVNMMLNEEPANVALLAAHLMPDIKAEFFRRLPPKFVSEIIFNMSKQRFVDPDVISTLKEELENRLKGATGGVNEVLEAIEKVDMGEKRKLLEELNKNHSELFSQVRKHILMIEDLELLNDKDLSILVSNVKIDIWARAFWEIGGNFKDKIKKQMLDTTWRMIEQTMSYGSPSKEKTYQALENIVGIAAKLIKDGQISNPLESAGQFIDGDIEILEENPEESEDSKTPAI